MKNKKENKRRTSFALSPNALDLLKAYSEIKGISMASSLEMFIREKASVVHNQQMCLPYRAS
jgi:hypothetical protein